MKANELRIGNFIIEGYVDNPEVLTVDGDSISFLDKTDCRNIKGIPLDEDWLLKFGFKKGSQGSIQRYDRNNVDIEYNGLVYYYGTLTTLTYVHQLQNLYFALIGEELTIKQ